MTLVEFLLARIAEDEAQAIEVQRHIDRWDRETVTNGPDGTQGSIVVTLVHHLPARMLVECEAKRRIVERYQAHLDRLEDPEESSRDASTRADEYDEWVLPLLALPYADHRDSDESWRP